MFFGRKLVTVIFVVILSMLSVMPVYAVGERIPEDDEIVDDVGEQQFIWEKTGYVWTCTDAYGEPVTGWAKKDGNVYFLNKNGEMRTGWVKAQGKWYYLYTEEDAKDKTIDKSQIGTMAKNTWIDNYFVDEEGVQKKIKK